MYEAHFGLGEAPFGITPDTSYFFTSAHSQEALNTLLVAVRSGGWDDAALRGAVAVFADVADVLAHFDASPFANV